ncbi:MAG: pyrroline-5-carboxylate reductase [Zetaproteobacteria bacterium]|nr:MAG: pyrroline-5-carboxylate reductase [Zetaproteobacteria bacterium]
MGLNHRQLSVAFIGGGNMARALIAGLARGGHAMDRVLVIEPDGARAQALADEFGVRVKSRQVKGIGDCGLVVLAVKPQQMQSVVGSVAARLGDDATLLSIAAGIECGRIRHWLGDCRVALVRAMPNTPAQVGSGIAALYSEEEDGVHRARAEYLLAACGKTIWVENEAQLHAVTAISGSGPAYFFLLTELLQASGVAMGLPAESAALLAAHTALGAGRMLVETGADPASLRQQVTSPNGTTQAALDVMYDEGLPDIVRRAVQTAGRRSRELARRGC